MTKSIYLLHGVFMAVPFIQLGQCGNQIGRQFYDIMFEEGCKASPAHQGLLESFFQQEDKHDIKAKAFSIDMEPKVVQKNLKMKKHWRYEEKWSLVQEEGSGNNWAYGCHVHGPKIVDQLLKMFRKFAEKEDYIKCFVQAQSMAGGTGSGLGTYIIQLLNEQFPKVPKFVTCVMPHLSGQVILQSYNACLSIGTIYPEADGIFIIQNDEISEICSKNLKIQKTSLDDINEIIGRNLASIFFPAVSNTASKLYSVEQNGFDYGFDLATKLFYDPRYKLASIKTVPHGPKDSQSFNSDNWQSLENDLTYRKKQPSFSEILIARGPDHPLSLKRNCSAIFDKHRFYNYNRSMTLLDNGPHFLQPLQQILTRGYNMLQSNSYIYQYQKYGIQKEQFLECFAQIQNIQTNYSKIAPK